MAQDDQMTFENFKLYYEDPSEPIFLERNNQRVYEFARKTPSLSNLTTADIIRYKDRLTDLSKLKEMRILSGRRRVLSTRQWKTYAPLNICKYYH